MIKNQIKSPKVNSHFTIITKDTNDGEYCSILVFFIFVFFGAENDINKNSININVAAFFWC